MYPSGRLRPLILRNSPRPACQAELAQAGAGAEASTRTLAASPSNSSSMAQCSTRLASGHWATKLPAMRVSVATVAVSASGDAGVGSPFSALRASRVTETVSRWRTAPTVSLWTPVASPISRSG